MTATIVLSAITAPTPGIDGELLAAFARLIPQLAPTAPFPTREELHAMLAQDGTTLLVARDRAQCGRIVGMLTLTCQRIPTGLRATIDDVVVDEAVRARGVGEALTREALQLAKSRGARAVDLTSHPSRQAANRLYQRLGFAPRDTNVYRFVFDEP